MPSDNTSRCQESTAPLGHPIATRHRPGNPRTTASSKSQPRQRRPPRPATTVLLKRLVAPTTRWTPQRPLSGAGPGTDCTRPSRCSTSSNIFTSEDRRGLRHDPAIRLPYILCPGIAPAGFAVLRARTLRWNLDSNHTVALREVATTADGAWVSGVAVPTPYLLLAKSGGGRSSG